MRRRVRAALIVGVALAPPWSAAAQKVDTVSIANGDHITGEIEGLARGRLSVSTDDIGKLSIEWDKIVRLVSPRLFEVELVTGQRFMGVLSSPTLRQLAITNASKSDTVPLIEVSGVRPLFYRALDRFKGYVDLGFTFQQANHLTQYSLSSLVDYRHSLWPTQLRVSSYLSNQEGSEEIVRNSLDVRLRRVLGDHWSALFLGLLEQNRELGLDLREQLGAGAAYSLHQSYRATLQGSAGLTYTRENFEGESEASNSLEAFLSGTFDFLRSDSPKMDLNVLVTLYPSITEPGRLRGNFNGRIAYEVIKDITLGLTMFEIFDTRPENPDLAENDFGITFTLGWTF